MADRRDDHTSSELRHDWLADRWVIIAPQRSARPEDFAHTVVVHSDTSSCPFCAGNETDTPDSVASYSSRSGNGKQNGRSSGWQVRVVPNKFPAVIGKQIRIDATAQEHQPSKKLVGDPCNFDLFRRRDLSGGHEVIIESPLHVQSVTELDRETVSLVFQAYRDRLAYWRTERDLAYAVVFKNVGHDAGASLAHAHSQLIATDVVPHDVMRALQRMEEYHDSQNACLFCRMLADEVEQKLRVVERTSNFTAFCPFASRLPSLVTIVPNQHVSSFESLNSDGLNELAWLTHRTVRRIELCYPNVAYNFVIHTAPQAKEQSPAFHWRMELFPRLTRVAGFEWGSECYINPLPPEKAAQNLRAATK